MKTYCFDLDNTLCKTINGDYKNSQPITKAINAVNLLYKRGNKIIIFTARYMGKMKGDITKVYNVGYNFTEKQLIEWGVEYHQLILGKPEYDIIIDDKSIFSRKLVRRNFKINFTFVVKNSPNNFFTKYLK